MKYSSCFITQQSSPWWSGTPSSLSQPGGFRAGTQEVLQCAGRGRLFSQSQLDRHLRVQKLTLSERVLKDFRRFIRHLSSVVKSAALKKSSYPQVPGSIPAENTSTQIHMDLSKWTLKQGFSTTVASIESNLNQCWIGSFARASLAPS